MELSKFDLERQSFENLVGFYTHELYQIISGVSAMKVFPTRTSRRMLRKYELIENQWGTPGEARTIVTGKACEVLGEWTNMFGEED